MYTAAQFVLLVPRERGFHTPSNQAAPWGINCQILLDFTYPGKMAVVARRQSLKKAAGASHEEQTIKNLGEGHKDWQKGVKSTGWSKDHVCYPSPP